LRWYDPQTMQWLVETDVATKEGNLVLEVTNLVCDLALKIELK